MITIIIAAGGAVGAICRFLITQLFSRSRNFFPYGTFIVNMGGTFLLGWLIGHHTQLKWLLFLGTGFCGAFTTFSTLQWELFQLKKDSHSRLPLLYLFLSYGGGIFSGFVGYYIGKIS